MPQAETARPQAPVAPAPPRPVVAKPTVVPHGAGPHRAPGGAASKASVRRSGSNPAVIWSCFAGVVVIIIVLIVVATGESEPQPRPSKTSVADNVGDTRGGEASWGDGTETETDSGTDPLMPDVKEPDVGEPETPVKKVPTKPTKPTKPQPKKPDPVVKLDRYRNLPSLSRFSGCSQETADKIIGMVKTALDSTYPRDANRASFALSDDHGKNAIPHIINGWLGLDMESLDREVLNQGNILNDILVRITRIQRQYDDRSEDQEGIAARMRCRYRWHKWWTEKGEAWEPPKETDEDL
jgi:hypothetical protein